MAPRMCASNKPLLPATGSGSYRRSYTFRLEIKLIQRNPAKNIRGCFASPSATCKWNQPDIISSNPHFYRDIPSGPVAVAGPLDALDINLLQHPLPNIPERGGPPDGKPG